MHRRTAPSALGAVLAGGLLAGCSGSTPLQEPIAGAPASLWLSGASVASFAVLQRGLVDVAYSMVTGQDCSVINIERRGEYCRTEAVATPVPFCTRSLGDVDCWTVAEPYGPQRAVPDTPARAERTPRRWSLAPF